MTLNEVAAKIQDLKSAMLFDGETSEGVEMTNRIAPIAIHEFSKAIAHLELARIAIETANLHQLVALEIEKKNTPN